MQDESITQQESFAIIESPFDNGWYELLGTFCGGGLVAARFPGASYRPGSNHRLDNTRFLVAQQV